jgi:hypothetical protein
LVAARVLRAAVVAAAAIEVVGQRIDADLVAEETRVALALHIVAVGVKRTLVVAVATVVRIAVNVDALVATERPVVIRTDWPAFKVSAG